ncbi:tetratricopeptide repeat protein [Flammeovirga aprica]|uniref:Tetratricopeptide repeat protein n=1 Tax=Flammeovirga aprica JL-4 TaxID=694437 RepID=A0A7X9XC80_9BACT|nr:tetratricopeptide repeat protein [Flammeovirga aprica]NME71532.1 tetratricopeptide repeat protein [Flammeovirga aprica JL-4]
MKVFNILLTVSFLLMNSPSIFAQELNVEELVRVGISYHDKGDYKKAIEVYSKALEADPNSNLVMFEMAFSHNALQEYKKTIKLCKKIIANPGENVVHTYVLYGNTLDQMGKPKKALKVYEEATKTSDNYLLFYNYGLTCYNTGDYDKAYGLFLKAIANNSAHPSSHLLLSKVMAKKNSRIKSMLPLYYFLMLEPNTERASIEYQNLRKLMDTGVSQSSPSNIDISISMNDMDSDFTAAEMMISLSNVTKNLEENKDKSDLELFAMRNKNIFNILGELKKDNKGFWWEFYVPVFYDLSTKGHVDSFSHYISLTADEEALEWIKENDEEFKKFSEWGSK